jgi:ribosomal protein S18 acetylase RimI-like enzyme
MAAEREAFTEVDTARTEELDPAFRIIFRGCSGADRELRVANALAMIREGIVDPHGVLVARGPRGLCGAMLCLPLPGASGLVWPPQAIGRKERSAVEDQLLRRACTWLAKGGAKLVQALLLPEEAALAGPLERNGFLHVTCLWYLRHNLELPIAEARAEPPLVYQTYRTADRAAFHRTLLLTYEDSRDCPEVNGIRTIDDIVAGHQAQGVFSPDRWFLALAAGCPVGVLLLADFPTLPGWEVAYLGVVPGARRRGYGTALTAKAIREARAARAAQLTLSVDARNGPAWDLYRRQGFEPYEQREVYLAIGIK